MWERDIFAKKQAWLAQEQTYKQDILNLQNSTDAKIIENLEQDLTKQKELLNQTIELLGKEDINTLNDLQTLLEGKTLKELIQQKEKTIIGLNKSYEKLASQKKTAKPRIKPTVRAY